MSPAGGRGQSAMKGRLGKAAVLVAAAAVLIPAWGGKLLAHQQEVTLESIMTYENSLVKAGMDSAGELLKTTKTEKSQTEGVWNELNEKYFTSFSRIGHFEFDSLLKREKDESASARAASWADAMNLFTQDLQSVGEVVEWMRNVMLDISWLETDEARAEDRFKAYLRAPEQNGPRMAEIVRDFKAGRLGSSEIQKCLDEVRGMRSSTENTSEAVIRDLEEVGKMEALGKDMDKRIVRILEGWGEMGARHPGVDPKLAAGAAAWIPAVKKRWENYIAAREKFDRAYAPLLEGKLFRDIPVFRDYEYKDLAGPVRELELELKTALVAAVQREKSEEELRRAVARDEELTKKEQARVMELWKSVSIEKARELQLAYARAAGGVNRVRELTILMSRLPEDSEDYRKASEEARLIQGFSHPEQLAAEKKIRDFEELERRVGEEVKRIIEEHEKRRRSLGLAPGIFSR
ncbi:MAG: hypothetical protein ACOYJV_06210 [Aminivibrio sp.]